MPVRGLTIIVAEANGTRLRTALTLACATAALGARARVFFDGQASAAWRDGGSDDARHAAAGLPTLPQLSAEALDLGVEIILCQSGLHLAGTTMADHDPRLHAGGLVSLLETLGDDRLVTL